MWSLRKLPGLPAAALRRARRAWFDLTPAERSSAYLFLALFLLGVVVRFWRVLF
jgi:hypothetical protein